MYTLPLPLTVCLDVWLLFWESDKMFFLQYYLLCVIEHCCWYSYSLWTRRNEKRPIGGNCGEQVSVFRVLCCYIFIYFLIYFHDLRFCGRVCRIVRGGNGLTDGPVTVDRLPAVMDRVVSKGFGNEKQEVQDEYFMFILFIYRGRHAIVCECRVVRGQL